MLKNRLCATAFGLAVAILASPACGRAATPDITIKADRYLDVVTGRLVAPAVVVVRDGRIAEVNPAAGVRGGRVVELPGYTLLPGLIDAHTHLTLDVENGWEHDAVTKSGADLALAGAANARRTLLAGFTTVRDLGAAHFADVALARAVEAGTLPGPRIIAAGHALGVTGGHCDVTGYQPEVLPPSFERGIGDSPAELVRAARHQIKHGAGVVKICATAGVMSNEATVGAQQPSLEELRAASEEAHRHGLKIAAHAVGDEGIAAAIEAGVDSIEHASMMTPATADLARRNGAYVVHTLYLTDAIDPASLPPNMRAKGLAIRGTSRDSFRLSLEKGLKVVFGTDAGVFRHGDNAREFAVRTGLGQSPIDAIRSATSQASALLGVTDRGEIRPGLLADLIAVQGDPLRDIRRLETVGFVMKGGQVFKAPGQPDDDAAERDR